MNKRNLSNRFCKLWKLRSSVVNRPPIIQLAVEFLQTTYHWRKRPIAVGSEGRFIALRSDLRHHLYVRKIEIWCVYDHRTEAPIRTKVERRL